ncbi:MAG: AsmA family protein [Candidatus Latescibacterota bacterium]
MTRRNKIIIGVILVLVHLFVLGGFLAVKFFPAERIRVMAEGRAARALGMPVRIGDLRLSFRGVPSVQATDIVVGPAAPGELPLAGVKSVKVRVSLLPLLKRQIDITSLVIDEPMVNLITRADSTTNLPALTDAARPKEAGKPGLPVPVSLHSLRIRKGTVSLINEKENSRTVLSEISQRLSLRISRDLKNLTSSGKLDIGSVDLWARGKRQPISGSKVQFSHELTGNAAAGDFALSGGELQVNGIPIKLTGEVKNGKNITFHAETGMLKAADVVAALPDSMLPNKKDVSAEGEASLVLDGIAQIGTGKPDVRYKGSLAIRDLTAAVKGFPKKIDHLRSMVDITESALTFRDTEVRIDQSRATLSGTVSHYLEKPDLALRTSGSLNMNDITSALPLFKENKPTGKVAFDLKVDGVPSPEIADLRLSGTLTLDNLVMNLPKALKNPAALNGTIRVSPDLIGLSSLVLKTGKSDITVTGGISNYLNILPDRKGDAALLKGTIASTLLDINDMLEIPKNAPIIKPWDLDEPLRNLPVPPSLRAEVGIRLGAVLFGRLKADSVQGSVTLHKGVLELSGLNVTAYNGALTGKTTINFSNPEQVVYSGGFNLGKLNAQTFITQFFNTGDHFRGLFSSAFTFSGAGLDSLSFFKNLKADGSGVFENGQVVNWEFLKKLGSQLKFLNFETVGIGKVQGSFQVLDNKVITPDLIAKTEYGDITLDGVTGLDTKINYRMGFDLNDKAVNLASKNRLGSFAELIASSKRPELRIAATGTLKSPSFKIDTTGIERNVKDRLKDEAQKLLGKQDSTLQQKGKKLLDRIFK